MTIVNGALELFAILIIAMPLVGIIGEKGKPLFQKYLMLSMVCHILVLGIDAILWIELYEGAVFRFVNLLVLTTLPLLIAFFSNAFFILSLLEYVSDKIRILKKTLPPLILLFAISIISWTFFIVLDGDNYVLALRGAKPSFHYKWLDVLSQFCWVIICIIGISIIFTFRAKLKHLELFSLISYCVFPIFALFSEPFWNGPQIYLSTTLSLVLIHTVLYREQKQRLRQQEAQLAQSRINVMINQIQPHFIFNTLSSICSLCDENHVEAKRVTGQFAEYLHHNAESLSQNFPIDLKIELRHVEVYLSIEKKRYEGRLNVLYDINAKDFMLPSLTIQPLVENAVKHGIAKRERKGTVRIATFETDTYFGIEISDDGVGFQLDEVSRNSNGHIGIENVKNRLAAMCNGTLTIDSEPGVGTTAVVKLPKSRGNR